MKEAYIIVALIIYVAAAVECKHFTTRVILLGLAAWGGGLLAWG